MREPQQQGTDLIGLSIPFFMLVMVVEVLVSVLHPRFKKRRLYRANDSFSNLSCGLMSELVKVHAKWLFLLPYAYVYKEFALYRAPLDSPLAWILVMLGVDLGYYCAHRASHTINIGWIAHATHHSSEYMNLTTSFRQSMFGQFFFFVFYLPLALFFPPQLYTLHYGLNMFYQFWIHTEMVPKLHPIIEFIFNTPSHHRVHHGRNPQYIDKNYGGMLIIWDRLFGTFEEEQEEVAYGLVHPIATWDVIWVQVHHIFAVASEVSRARGIGNKIRMALAGPGWTLAKDGVTWVAHPIPAIDWKQPKYDPYVPGKVTLYVFVQFAVTLIMSVIFLKTARFLGFKLSMVITMYIVFCLEVYAKTFNRSSSSKPLEVIRIFLTFGLSLYLTQAFLSVDVQYYAVLASGMFIGLSLKMFEAIQYDWQFYEVPLHKSVD